MAILHALPAPILRAADGQFFPYDWRVNFLSEFVRTDYAPLMTAGFVALGVAGASLAAVLRSCGRTREAACLAVAALMSLLLALFPTDLAFDREEKTLIGRVHNPLSTLAYLPCFCAMWLGAQKSRALKNAAIVSGILLIILVGAGLVWLLGAIATDPRIADLVGPHRWVGLMQRGVAASLLFWLTALARSLTKVPDR